MINTPKLWFYCWVLMVGWTDRRLSQRIQDMQARRRCQVKRWNHLGWEVLIQGYKAWFFAVFRNSDQFHLIFKLLTIELKQIHKHLPFTQLYLLLLLFGLFFVFLDFFLILLLFFIFFVFECCLFVLDELLPIGSYHEKETITSDSSFEVLIISFSC